MTEDEKISKRILILMFIGCLVLLIAVSFACIFYSPKSVISPSFTSSEFDDYQYYQYDQYDKSEVTDSVTETDNNSSVFPIDINSATYEELQLIPNIGPFTAKLIIDYRNEFGTIISMRELLSIDGIGEKTVERLKEYCVIK